MGVNIIMTEDLERTSQFWGQNAISSDIFLVLVWQGCGDYVIWNVYVYCSADFVLLWGMFKSLSFWLPALFSLSVISSAHPVYFIVEHCSVQWTWGTREHHTDIVFSSVDWGTREHHTDTVFSSVDWGD